MEEEEDLERIKAAVNDMEILMNENKVSQQADHDFHYAIAIASKNPHYLGLLKYIDNSLASHTQSTAVAPITRKIQALKEHEQICHAIEKGDPDAARAAMRLHLSGTRERMTARLNS